MAESVRFEFVMAKSRLLSRAAQNEAASSMFLTAVLDACENVLSGNGPSQIFLRGNESMQEQARSCNPLLQNALEALSDFSTTLYRRPRHGTSGVAFQLQNKLQNQDDISRISRGRDTGEEQESHSERRVEPSVVGEEAIEQIQEAAQPAVQRDDNSCAVLGCNVNSPGGFHSCHECGARVYSLPAASGNSYTRPR